MSENPIEPREIIARAICRHEGLEEDEIEPTTSRLNWQLYLWETDFALDALTTAGYAIVATGVQPVTRNS